MHRYTVDQQPPPPPGEYGSKHKNIFTSQNIPADLKGPKIKYTLFNLVDKSTLDKDVQFGKKADWRQKTEQKDKTQRQNLKSHNSKLKSNI